MRATLYMAEVSAVRYHPPLADFYRRLRGRGKPAKLALTAVMPKAPPHPQCDAQTSHRPERAMLRVNQRRVAHKSTGGMFPSIPEPVDPVGNALKLVDFQHSRSLHQSVQSLSGFSARIIEKV